MLPVVLLIAVGFVAGRRRLIRAEAVRDLSNLVFLVLVQALLFRTMATAHLERLDLRSVALYYVVAGAMFVGAAAVARPQQPFGRAGAGGHLQQHA
jgi:malonate transporter